MIEILHRSDRMEVRRVAAGDGRRVVITFDAYHDVKGFDREGFGESYFAREGITAIHLLTHGNDWFQYPDLPQVLAIIRAAAAGAERRLAYGSSMGGYGALRFAGAVGAEAALALSPQWSVDPRKAPFERRWMQDQRRIRFRPELDGRLAFAGRAVIAYDPTLEPDRRHAEAIAAEIEVERLALPYAGHPAGAFLAETGLLRPLAADALADTLDLAEFRTLAHARRTSSPTWLGELAQRQPPHRTRLALALAERAAGQAPEHPAVLNRFAERLAAAGDHERAVEVHRRAIAIHRIPAYQWGLSRTLAAAGRAREALTMAAELQAAAPDVAGYHRWAAKLRERLGDRRGAFRDLKAAVRLAPRNLGYWKAAIRAGVRLFGRV